MGLLRRMFAWILIFGGGLVLCSLAVSLIIDRPEGSAPLPLKAVLLLGLDIAGRPGHTGVLYDESRCCC